MKNIKLSFLAIFSLIVLFSCTKENDNVLTGGAKTGALIDVTSGLVGYAVGNGNDYKYPVSFKVFQGAIKTTKVEIYKSFSTTIIENDKEKVVKSNEVLWKTIEVPTTPQAQVFSFDVTYNELIGGLIIFDAPLPTSDSLLAIGDAWTLKYVTTTSNGELHTNAQTTKVAVGTRFAGKYKVIKGEYWRINTPRPDVVWVGETRTIESVDAITYKFLDYAGPFKDVKNTHYFTIDGLDVVKTPILYKGTAQLLNAFGVINCFETPANMSNACNYVGPQNTVFRDNVDGKDIIYRTYGYINPATGSREIYEVLEKIVE